jgi:hypothetical protein
VIRDDFGLGLAVRGCSFMMDTEIENKKDVTNKEITLVSCDSFPHPCICSVFTDKHFKNLNNYHII